MKIAWVLLNIGLLKIIYDITSFRIGAYLIDREAVLILHSKNFEIHDVKQSENINGYWLNSLLCFNSSCSVSSGRFVLTVICVFASFSNWIFDRSSVLIGIKSVILVDAS